MKKPKISKSKEIFMKSPKKMTINELKAKTRYVHSLYVLSNNDEVFIDDLNILEEELEGRGYDTDYEEVLHFIKVI